MKKPFELEYHNYRNWMIEQGKSPHGKTTYSIIRRYFEDIGLLNALINEEKP